MWAYQVEKLKKGDMTKLRVVANFDDSFAHNKISKCYSFL